LTAREIDLGPGDLWAQPAGVTEAHRRLLRFMASLTLAEFLELANTLTNSLPDGGERDDFVNQLNLLKSLPPAPVRQVLLHPIWIYWVRSTRQIAKSWISGKEIAAQWRGHLHPKEPSSLAYLQESLALFPLLVLAAHMLAASEINVQLRLRGARYLSIPGTGFCCDVSTISSLAASPVVLPIRLQAHDDGSGFRLNISQEPGLQLTYRVEEGRIRAIPESGADSSYWLQTVSLGNYTFEIDNRDERILQNWVRCESYPAGVQVRPASDAEIPAWQARLGQAMATLRECCAPLQDELVSLLRCVVPVTSHTPELSISCSSRDFWGAVQVSPHPGVAMAEVLAHEYRHNLLNALLEADPILDEGCSREDRFYSPWRPDPRPLIGLLHGIYSFTEVVGFYQTYLERFGKQAPQAELAQERLTSNTCRLQLGVQELAANARFTEFGDALFRGLQQRIEEFDRQVRQSDGPRRDATFRQLNQQHSAWLLHQRLVG
jgi:HEXXH motif-containing protein